MVLNEEFPPDFRVEKEAQSLINEGHQITILCYTTRNDQPKEAAYDGIRIKRVRINKALRDKLHALYLVIPFHKWIWEHRINKIMKEDKPDVIHIHDLPFADIGVKMKKKYGVKLICDQHEYYSNWIGQNAHLNTFIGKIVKKLSNWKKYERKNLNQADLVMTIEEPLRQIYIDEVGISPEKVITSPNTPPKDFAESTIHQEILDRYKDNFVLFYSGGIDILRGVFTAINAMPEIARHIPEVKLVLAGKVWKKYDPVAKAKSLDVEQYVDFVGWVSIDQMPSYIQASNICFHVPPAHNKEINRTIQTKIYQYLHLGKPVIVGQAKMARDFITQNNLGFAIRENDSKDFAEKVIYLYDHPHEREKISKNAQTISKNYFWEKTIKNMVNFYTDLSTEFNEHK